MSQNKTIVPGVDYDNHNDSQDDFAYGGLYSRSGDESQRTYVPGVRQQPASVLPNNSVVSNSPILHNQRENNRKIVMQEQTASNGSFLDDIGGKPHATNITLPLSSIKNLFKAPLVL